MKINLAATRLEEECMKSNYILWALGAIVVLLGGYYLLMQPNASDQVMTDTTPTGVESPTVLIPLDGQNDLGQTGSATLTENADGQLVVELSLVGGEFSDPQPAHIHSGACPNPGPVVHPLTNVVNGQSATVLPVSWTELVQSGEPLAINVHKSAAEASVYTACGDLPVEN
jgi:hypothetical protein